jgi:hypothetical protein
VSPRKTSTTAKDDKEWKHFEMFRRLLSDFPAGDVRKIDPPAADFLVDTPHGPLGIELARIINAPRREQEMLRNAAVDAARLEFMQRGLPVVHASFFWSKKPLPKLSESKQLGQALADFVEAHIPRSETAHLKLEWEELRAAGLDGLLSFVHIHRIPGISTLSWGSPDAEWVGTHSALVPELVAKKMKKLPEYRRFCSEVWLLLIADGEELSGMVDEAALAQQVLEASFERIYLLEVFSARLYRLPVQRLGT